MNQLKRTTGRAVRLGLGLTVAVVVAFGPELIHDARLMHRKHSATQVSHKAKPAKKKAKITKRAPVLVLPDSIRAKLQTHWAPDPATIKARDKLLASACSFEAQAGRAIATGRGTVEETRRLVHNYDQAAGIFEGLGNLNRSLSARWNQLGASQQLPSHTELGFRNKERDEQVGLALSAIKRLNKQLLSEMMDTARHASKTGQNL